jgi:hypothetical protein
MRFSFEQVVSSILLCPHVELEVGIFEIVVDNVDMAFLVHNLETDRIEGIAVDNIGASCIDEECNWKKNWRRCHFVVEVTRNGIVRVDSEMGEGKTT